mgnify:CR=1 FL=1
MILIHQIFIEITASDCYRRKILADRHLVLKTAGLYLLLKQAVFRSQRQGSLVISPECLRILRNRTIQTDRQTDAVGRMTDILGQQIPGKSQAIFQIDTATLRFVYGAAAPEASHSGC